VAKKRSVTPDGDAVRQARLARGWRPEHLARHADCSLRTVENAERSVAVYANTLASIALALGVGYKTLLAKADSVSQADDTLRTRASIIIAAKPDEPPPVEQVIAELTGRASLVDGIAVGTSRAGHFPAAPDGGLLINMTLTYRDARKLAETLRSGNLGMFEVRAYSATDCSIWMFARPPVEPE
jgi:transcriptional regulator with XRE-family HTH domain